MAAPRTIIRVWDFPVRLTHWLLVPLIAFSWWSAEEGELEWHRWSGYAVLGLVVFRIAWGIVGSDTARFSRFLRGPGAIAAYLKQTRSGGRQASVGHNPLGAWSVVAMLGLLLAQVLLGLFAVDRDGIESGPLAEFVSFETGRLAAAAHELVFNALLGVIGLHLAAIAFYALAMRENLIGPMLTGRKALEPAPETPPRMGKSWLAALLALGAGALVYAVAKAFRAF